MSIKQSQIVYQIAFPAPAYTHSQNKYIVKTQQERTAKLEPVTSWNIMQAFKMTTDNTKRFKNNNRNTKLCKPYP